MNKDQMIEFTFLVPKNKAGDMHFMLDGQVYNLEVTPVRTAKPAPNGKVRSTARTGGLLESMVMWVTNHPDVEEVTSTEIKEAITADGWSKDSYSQALTLSVKAGLLKKAGRGVYKVKRPNLPEVKAKAKKPSLGLKKQRGTPRPIPGYHSPLSDALGKYLKKHNTQTLTTQDIPKILPEVGFSKGSGSQATINGMRAGFLRRSGFGTYDVVTELLP